MPLPLPILKVTLLFLVMLPPLVRADVLSVAVAANFTVPMQKIAAAFERESGHTLQISYGSTGKFYAQIISGAPFEVLLSADEATPIKLAQEAGAQGATRFTYAQGHLVLWSSDATLVDAQGQVLSSNKTSRLAIADPKLAPYGAAAVQVLQKMNLLEQWQTRWVTAENMTQAYQFVATGNAHLGFVAASQVFQEGKLIAGSGWRVPKAIHAGIKQDAIVLKKGQGSRAATVFMTFLRSPQARRIIAAHGYETAQ
jgi:molybdate transport system substrate-binding protein